MRQLDDTKALKVSLPVGQHLKLHQLKVLTGRTISEIVEDAVEDYLELVDEPSEELAEDLEDLGA